MKQSPEKSKIIAAVLLARLGQPPRYGSVVEGSNQ
jgi:hypothetical protein